MNRYSLIILGCMAAAILATSCANDAPAPYGPLPTPSQVAWQQMETNMFVHFGPNTFSGKEWGDGTEPEDMFAPDSLDCRQWVRTAKLAGFKGIIITAKHHDGFCLWPNPESVHTVAQSSWRDGKGDVLKELSDACREYGVKFGVYISPWDRHDPHYGTPEYNNVYIRTLQSALTSYGEVFEQWFDGACGEGPNGKRQVYDWPAFNAAVAEMQPGAVIFSDIGPGCRWVGNERGSAGETCWSALDTEGFGSGKDAPSQDTLNTGNVHGRHWIPAESDVSIRPGWFWRESENDKVKSVEDLIGIYYTSVGRNSLMLLNVPPDTSGRIHRTDSIRLMEFRTALDGIFAVNLADGAEAVADNERGRRFRASNLIDGEYDTFWACDDGCLTPSFTLTLPEPRTFNLVVLQEYIPLGQRVSSFAVEARNADGEWSTIGEGTTIGYKRILRVPDITASEVRVRITSAYACPVLAEAGLYMDNISE